MPFRMNRIAAPYTLFPVNHRSWLPQRLALVVQSRFYSVQRLSRKDVEKPKHRHQRAPIRSPFPVGQKYGVLPERLQLLSADVLRFRQKTDTISRDLPAEPESLQIWIAEFLRLGKQKLLDSHDSAEVLHVNMLCLAQHLTSRLSRQLVSYTTLTGSLGQRIQISRNSYTD